MTSEFRGTREFQGAREFRGPGEVQEASPFPGRNRRRGAAMTDSAKPRRVAGKEVGR